MFHLQLGIVFCVVSCRYSVQQYGYEVAHLALGRGIEWSIVFVLDLELIELFVEIPTLVK